LSLLIRDVAPRLSLACSVGSGRRVPVASPANAASPAAVAHLQLTTPQALDKQLQSIANVLQQRQRDERRRGGEDVVATTAAAVDSGLLAGGPSRYGDGSPTQAIRDDQASWEDMHARFAAVEIEAFRTLLKTEKHVQRGRDALELTAKALARVKQEMSELHRKQEACVTRVEAARAAIVDAK
jgi:hypothetical protein